VRKGIERENEAHLKQTDSCPTKNATQRNAVEHNKNAHDDPVSTFSFQLLLLSSLFTTHNVPDAFQKTTQLEEKKGGRRKATKWRKGSVEGKR
jgi:hypothetical protein